MTNLEPPARTSYHGGITNTDRWANFTHRDDDIFICTPPKCGTTWTQAICAMLIFGTAEHGHKPNALSPWIDGEFEPIDEYLKKVDLQTHRRFFKTHTPLDGLPYFPTCTYLVVLRDPRDAYLSGLKHRANMLNQEAARTIFSAGDDAFSDWLHRPKRISMWDEQSFDAFVHFFRSYWSYRDLPNVHLYHYSDMVRDLRGSIASMAATLGIGVTDQQLDEFAQAASFDTMKRDAGRFAPYADLTFWKSESGFFAGGGVEQWKNEMSDAEIAEFSARAASLLAAEEMDWLLNGSG